MQDQLKKLEQEARELIAKAASFFDLDKIDIEFMGRKEGKLNNILKAIKDLASDEKVVIGKLANDIKQNLLSLIGEKRAVLSEKDIAKKLEESSIDVTLPGKSLNLGTLSPLTQVQNELEDLFKSMGFMVLDGPELESDYYNFEALNIPAHHPARDMQDTFYVESKAEEKMVLRTHTSPMQVRAMQKFRDSKL